MSTNDPRHYDVIIAPVITEKATNASEQSKVVFKVTLAATKPQIKEAVEKLFDVKVKSVNTLRRRGKWKVFSGRYGLQADNQARHRDPRRGSSHRRDHGTVRERARWHSRATIRSRLASASSSSSTAPAFIPVRRSRR